MLYADSIYYTDVYAGTVIPSDKVDEALKKASRHIDALTYSRIVGRGINALTEFQQNIIKECTCMIADFEYANEDVINSVLSSYAINGVSMGFSGNGANVSVTNGICVQKDTYSLLMSTGLTSQVLR